MSAKLLVDGPGMWAFAHPLTPGKVVRVGRTAENDLRLNDRAVSGRHAEIHEAGGIWHVRDLGSSNGTFLNGRKIKDAMLATGDVLKFGKCEVVFLCSDPDDRQTEQSWDKTKVEMLKDESALRALIEKGSTSDPGSIPSFIGRVRIASQVEKEVGIDSAPAVPKRGVVAVPPSSSAPVPVARATPEPEPEGESAEDTLWIAERLAEIVSELVRTRAEERSQAVERIMQRLRDALEADNGFVMVAEPQTNRWVIRASVGDVEEWTSYEKEHPVPLTVANRAYTSKRVVSNALGEKGAAGFDNSSSMMLLNVHHYIAVPLLVQDKRRGVLYFDTRQPMKKFLPRHVRLLERVGGYILDVEKQT